MTGILHSLQAVLSLGFVVLGAAAIVEWLRRRGRARAYLALALGALGAVAALSEIQTLTHQAALLSGMPSLLFFLLSAYGLLLFRNEVLSYPRWLLPAALIAGLALSVATVLGTAAGSRGVAMAAGLTVLLLWAAAIAEPAVRFWLASRGVTAVQRARLRSLTLGYGGLLLIVLVDVLTFRSPMATTVQVATTVFGILLLPVLYVSLSPPLLLRHAWRAPEEEAFREAVRPLLLYTPEGDELAAEALRWAMRLIGADAGFIASTDRIIARHGIDDAALEMLRSLPRNGTASVPMPGRRGEAIVVGLPLASGPGVLAVVTGRLTPFFGKEELGRLEEYATSLTAALDRVALTERLADLAATDSLTALPNRRTFDAHWEEEGRRAERYQHALAVIAVDIDHFKLINDKFGHTAGDEVLRSVAVALNAGLRAGDMAARLGGEEFGVLLPHTEVEGATEVAQRIRTAVAEGLSLPDGSQCTISAGVAAFPGLPVAVLRDAADQALYDAKAQGRNRVMAAPGTGGAT